ncbi:MAG: sulfatase-like hydrolase/transferase [Balneolaceae bacterium]
MDRKESIKTLLMGSISLPFLHAAPSEKAEQDEKVQDSEPMSSNRAEWPDMPTSLSLQKLVMLVVCLTVLPFFLSACETDREEDAAGAGQPNIIFILTDDLGYGDLGVFFQNQRAEDGRPSHQTPHLDTMAGEGMRLSRHYVGAPVCAPARASLLQGVHQGHANIRNNQFDKALSDNHNLASVVRQAGYATGIIGKWGLQGRDGDSPETWEAYPTKRGFDHFFGYVRHRDGHNHYPAHEVAERPKVELYSGEEEISGQLRGAYTTDLFTAAAKKWITDQRQRSPDQPFFLYLAYDTPHAGLEVASSPYPDGGGLNGGVRWIGEKDNFINTVDGTIDDYIHPDYAGQDWPMTQKRLASMIRRIDNGVGDLMQLLRDLEIDENTVVVFTSDNGPHRESYGYGEYDPTFFESFGPLDGIKRDTWEGGIRVPTIVHWPGRIPAGTLEDRPTGFHDWLPTFAELAGLPAPARTDGVSLLPLLTGGDDRQENLVYVEYSEGRRTPDYEQFDASHRNQLRGEMQVIYVDGYKGVRYDIQSAEDDFRIYDTLEDPEEINNLAGSSENFDNLQRRMKDRVIRVRRADPSAERPYDGLPVPSLEDPGDLEPGLRYEVYESATPWTPAAGTLRKRPVRTGTCEGFDPDVRSREDHIVVEYSGWIEVPHTGAYTFHLQANRGAVMRIHGATVIDADRGYEAGSEAASEIQLEEGYHPIKLTWSRGEEGTPLLRLQWSGPGIDLQEPDPSLFHN